MARTCLLGHHPCPVMPHHVCTRNDGLDPERHYPCRQRGLVIAGRGALPSISLRGDWKAAPRQLLPGPRVKLNMSFESRHAGSECTFSGRFRSILVHNFSLVELHLYSYRRDVFIDGGSQSDLFDEQGRASQVLNVYYDCETVERWRV